MFHKFEFAKNLETTNKDQMTVKEYDYHKFRVNAPDAIAAVCSKEELKFYE